MHHGRPGRAHCKQHHVTQSGHGPPRGPSHAAPCVQLYHIPGNCCKVAFSNVWAMHIPTLILSCYEQLATKDSESVRHACAYGRNSQQAAYLEYTT